MKRISAILLAIVLVFSLVGCGKGKKRQPIQLTLSTEDSEAILRAAGIQLPEADTAAGANSVVKYFGWGDPFQNYDENEVVSLGYWTFQNKYNSSITYIETDYFDRFDDLALLITAGDPPDMTVGGNGSTAMFPMSAIKTMIQPVDPWIDYNDPLWRDMKDLADLFTLGGKHYQITIESTPSNVCLYNRRVFDEYGYEDPAELYYNDEWTWDKFYEMCADFSDVDEDRFALDGYPYSGAMIESSGQQLMQIDENGKFYSNVDSPEIERAQNLLYELCKNDCNYRGSDGSRWARRDQDGGPCGMKEGKLLFYILGESFFQDTVENIEANFGAISEGELMFAPLPRDPLGDGNYYMASTFNDIYGCYVIVNNARNPEGAALLSACIRFKVIDPIVSGIATRQLKETYLWSDDMISMSEECAKIAAAHRVFDLGGNLPENLGNALNGISWAIARSSNPQSWGQLKEQYGDQIEFYIEQLNDMIDQYNEG